MGAEASYLGVWDTKAVQGQREEPRWRGHLNMALQVGTGLDWLSGDIIRRCDRELLGHFAYNASHTDPSRANTFHLPVRVRKPSHPQPPCRTGFALCAPAPPWPFLSICRLRTVAQAMGRAGAKAAKSTPGESGAQVHAQSERGPRGRWGCPSEAAHWAPRVRITSVSSAASPREGMNGPALN